MTGTLKLDVLTQWDAITCIDSTRIQVRWCLLRAHDLQSNLDILNAVGKMRRRLERRMSMALMQL